MDGRGAPVTVDSVPSKPAEPKVGLWTGILGHLSRFFSATKTISYDEARILARHEDPDVRHGVATSPVALGEIDLLLACNADQGVRLGLALKIARLAPELNARQRDRIRQSTYEALEVLARDQVIRVRQVLSEALKDVANAPPEVINRLARDAELVVAAPVLQFSPVLTDEDLLDIIAAGPVQGALSAICRRHQVVEMVSDAVVESDDVEAITDLLANPSAQIREETLDRVVDRAPMVEAWQAPLVRRPSLPSPVAPRLAMFVADNLLDVLIRRRDLDEKTAEEVRIVVARRLGESPGEGPGREMGGKSVPPEVPLEKIGARGRIAPRTRAATARRGEIERGDGGHCPGLRRPGIRHRGAGVTGPAAPRRHQESSLDAEYQGHGGGDTEGRAAGRPGRRVSAETPRPDAAGGPAPQVRWRLSLERRGSGLAVGFPAPTIN